VKTGDNVVVPPCAKSKKRGTRQIWVQVPVQVVGEGSAESAEKRQRTASVFDRLKIPSQTSANPDAQGRREQ
jgi:hypothetical protein